MGSGISASDVEEKKYKGGKYILDGTIDDELDDYPPPSVQNKIINSVRFQDNIVSPDDILGSDDADRSSVIANNVQQRENLTISFVSIDEHARTAGPDACKSFDTLIQYFSEDIKHHENRKTLLVRAIIVWMSSQEDTWHVLANTNTPKGLLRSVKKKKMSMTTCFTILCRKAKIPCVRIKGYMKGANFEPGDMEVPIGKWNAVYVESGWQLLCPQWILEGIEGFNLGGWTKLEQDGQQVMLEEKASSGVLKKTFNEHYFFPDPNIFIYECCALKPEWQLVDSPVHSESQVAKMPLLQAGYFVFGFKLVSEHTSVVDSKNGFCKVVLECDRVIAEETELKYELFQKNQDETKSSFDEDNWSRMVFNLRKRDLFTFEVRFPSTGIYKLNISLKPMSALLISTKLICEEPMSGRSLLPLSCAEIGWGPGPSCEKAGLLMPSKPSGLISLPKGGKETSMSFHMRDPTTIYSAECHGEVGGRLQKIDNSISVTRSEFTRMLTFTATIPHEGEFGVAINSTTKYSKPKNVCNYLLSTYSSKGVKANVRLCKQRLNDAVTKDVDPELWSRKITSIQECIEKCRNEHIPDTDDDVIYAMKEVELLRHRNLLRDCVLRRNLDVIKRTLIEVNMYENKSILTPEIENVKQLQVSLMLKSEENSFSRDPFGRAWTHYHLDCVDAKY